MGKRILNLRWKINSGVGKLYFYLVIICIICNTCRKFLKISGSYGVFATIETSVWH